MFRITSLRAMVSACALTIMLPSVSHASNPPLSWVVPFAAGGTSDILARVIGERLGAMLNTTVVVENRTGAGGNIGSAYAANAKPDGNLVVGGTISSHAINVSLYPDMQYDPLRSFEPVTLLGTLPNVLVVRADSPYKTAQDVLAAAKADPGRLTFGSSGNGTSQHLSGELFKSLGKVAMTHVPYRGGTGATNDLLAGNISMIFENVVVAAPFIRSGQLRALGVTSPKRSQLLPDVPTLAETGLDGYEIVSWQAVFAPAKTPTSRVEQLAKAIATIMQEPAIQSRLQGLGLEQAPMGPQALADYQQSEIEKWAALIKAQNIRFQ